MRQLEYARARVEALLREIDRVAESEFPTPHSELALDHLRDRFRRELEELRRLDERSDPDVVAQKCALALTGLFDYLPLVGFVLRSTNVRNAFEEFGPLLRLAGNVLEPTIEPKDRKTRLVLSSEWDYSPLTYPNIAHLPGFVLIGLPAPESGNPLLVPLAGHELGHSVWVKQRVSAAIGGLLKEKVVETCKQRWGEFQRVFPYLAGVSRDDLTTDLAALAQWSQVVPWALHQAEETFCDFIGVRIFGTSFLQAFAYLLSPKAGPRSVYYPGMRRRISNQEFAASTFGVAVPEGYSRWFEDNEAVNLTDGDRLRVSVADDAVAKLLRELVQRAGDSIAAASLPTPSAEEVERILERFRRVVPAENTKTIVDILNAAWQAYEDRAFWGALPELAKEREFILGEVVLKNLEIFEIEQILRES